MNLILGLVIFSSYSFGSLTEILSKEVPVGCLLTKETKYLKQKVEGKKLILRHRKVCGDKTSYLYIENHLVRTMNQVLMIDVLADKISGVKVLKFYEPKEYSASKSWLKSLEGKDISQLNKREGIDSISGATITANSSIRNIEKVLNIHQAIELEN